MLKVAQTTAGTLIRYISIDDDRVVDIFFKSVLSVKVFYADWLSDLIPSALIVIFNHKLNNVQGIIQNAPTAGTV